MKHLVFDQSRAPLYLQLAEILRQKIEEGIWREGDKLPTVEKLAAEYGLAKVTVRQAIKVLEEEKRLLPMRGRGTTILGPPKNNRWLKVETRFTDLVDMYEGDEPELVPLEDRKADLPKGVFRGTPAEEYHMIKRMHARDGQRYSVITLYLAQPHFGKYEDRLRHEIVLPVLRDAPDVVIATAHQSMKIRKCDIESAGLLGLSIGDPVADVQRILCDPDGTIIYLADVVYRGDFIHLEMDLLA